MTVFAVYYRVSTDKQDIASQRQSIESFLANLPEDRQPRQVIEYCDEAMSGRNAKRPAYQRLLQDCYAGKISTILTYRLDRISRDATHAIRTLLELDEAGVGFISATQPVLNLGHDNPFRRTMLSAFAEIAEIERETIVARVKSGLEAAKKRGVKLGPPVQVTPETKEQALELRQSGKSIRFIANQLNLSVGTIHKLVRSSPQA